MPDSTGSFGAPPPEAQREITQPLSQAAIEDQLARASSNEKKLAPFNPQPTAVPVVPLKPEPDENTASRLLAAVRETLPERQTHPAASDTDSPSRGVPKPIADLGKQITGGFGDAMQAQYFPLDGSELRAVCMHLMGELSERLKNDLRFSPAITYPRVSVKVQIVVEGYVSDGGFTVVKHMIPHDKTPVDVALAHGDEEMCFAVTAIRQEFTPEGESTHPPDYMRDETGLDRPYKRRVEVPGGFATVDTVPKLDGIF